MPTWGNTQRAATFSSILALAAAAAPAPAPAAEPAVKLAKVAGPFQPTAASLKSYQVPDWFRDAKFGIWSHWGPQAVPRAGDWYARNMYIWNSPQYNHLSLIHI